MKREIHLHNCLWKGRLPGCHTTVHTLNMVYFFSLKALPYPARLKKWYSCDDTSLQGDVIWHTYIFFATRWRHAIVVNSQQWLFLPQQMFFCMSPQTTWSTCVSPKLARIWNTYKVALQAKGKCQDVYYRQKYKSPEKSWFTFPKFNSHPTATMEPNSSLQQDLPSYQRIDNVFLP